MLESTEGAIHRKLKRRRGNPQKIEKTSQVLANVKHFPFSKKTSVLLFRVKSGKVIVDDKGKKTPR